MITFLYKCVLSPFLRALGIGKRDPNDTDSDGQFG